MATPPFLDAYRVLLGESVALDPLPHDELDRRFESMRLVRCSDEPPLRFVPSPKKPRRRKERVSVDAASSYDGSIALRREVPTRDADLHDHCNFLAWLLFPRSKRAIHERQYRAKEAWIPSGAARLPGARTREQDALTLFDEGGVVTLGASATPRVRIVFGHALLEHFARTTTPIAATEMRIDLPDETGADAIDRAVATRIADPTSFLSPGLDGLVVLHADGSFLPRDSRG